MTRLTTSQSQIVCHNVDDTERFQLIHSSGEVTCMPRQPPLHVHVPGTASQYMYVQPPCMLYAHTHTHTHTHTSLQVHHGYTQTHTYIYIHTYIHGKYSISHQSGEQDHNHTIIEQHVNAYCVFVVTDHGPQQLAIDNHLIHVIIYLST